MLQISVLGPLEVRRDGRSLAVPAGKASELLVRLALEAGVPVRADRLLDELWDGAGARRNTLQAKVTPLRRALGDPPVIASGDGGYLLAVEPSSVDALAVLQQTGTATRLLEAGDDRGAAELCASALTLFRGDLLLPAAGDGEWVTPHRARFDEARMRLIEIRFAARSRLGDAGELIGDLEEAVAANPFREGLWEMLITALYRAGRQAEALTGYQRIRNRLSDELGIEPGPRLQQLENKILTQHPALGVPGRRAAASAHREPSGNLPSMVVELLGRQREITVVSDLLAGSRLVSVVGPGGIGKTALAIAAGRRLAATGGWSGGVWLARLETATTPNDVTDAVIAALAVPGGEEALVERLRGSTAVLILDNCEHVVDAAAALAVRLLDAAPGLRVLCTSQLPLDIDGEGVFELEPLALSDAVELFTRRATVQRLTDPSREREQAVLGLCRALDGLPLAIELAAARTKTLSIEEITRRLDDRFTVLSDPTSRRPERRRSLKSTIRWSYDLLFPDDQRGLWALAGFAGGAPLPAVEFVLEALDVPAAAAIDVVGRLASRSLVIVDQVGVDQVIVDQVSVDQVSVDQVSVDQVSVDLVTRDDAVSLPAADGSEHRPKPWVRYRLLDSIRAFAREEMAAAGLTDRALAAHAAWFVRAADACTEGVRSGRQAEFLGVVRAERANIDAALSWSTVHDPQLALRMVNGFGWAWVVLGDSRGADRILTALDAAGDAAQSRERGTALLLAAWIEAAIGALDLAKQHVAAASEVAEAIDDVELRARCTYYLAYVVSHLGEFTHAFELTDRSEAIYAGLDRPWDRAANGLFAARAAISAGDEERSVLAVDRVRRLLRAVDDPWLQVRGEATLGELARLQRRFDDAVLHLGRAAETSRRRGFAQTEAYQLSSLGRAQCQAGDYAAGPATLELAVEKAEATGDVRLAALARVHLGRVLRAQGQVARARTVIEAATAWHRGAGGGEQARLGECLLAALDAADLVPDAEERLGAILDDARLRGDAPVEVFALDALARVAAGSGNLGRARDLCAAADLRMAAASHFITEADRSDAHWVRLHS